MTGVQTCALPISPEYYFLSSTTNPTRYSILMYDYNTPSQFQEVVRILEQHKVRCVIWDTNFVRNTPLFFSGVIGPTSASIIEPYLESHYKVVWEENGVRIMERREDVHAN